MDEAAVARYLQHVMPEASNFQVCELTRIVGGASRTTWSLDATWNEDGREKQQGLIFRMDPNASLLPSNRDDEYQTYRHLEDSAIPTPAALWMEPTGDWLDGPFFVLERIDGCETAGAMLFEEPYVQNIDRIGHRMFEIEGEIAAYDWRAAGWSFMDEPAADACWEHELGVWEGRIEESRYDTQPIVRAAIDWLRRHPPPPAQRVSVVHGDYRTGNFLFNEAGEIRGILDWEMVHLGDPLEDIAWTALPHWRSGRLDRLGGLLPDEEAHRIWEKSSGLRVDSETLRWWRVFSHVKAHGIWLTGGRSFADGETDALQLAMIVARLTSIEDQFLLALLGWSDGGS